MTKTKIFLIGCIAVLLGLWFVVGFSPVAHSDATSHADDTSHADATSHANAISHADTPSADPTVAVPSALASDQSGPWLTDLQSAADLASRQNKDILLEFTSNGPVGSATPAERKLNSIEFANSPSASNYVLVRFECHNDAPGADREGPERDTWCERLNVSSFPLLVLLDMRGRPCGNVDLAACAPADLETSIAAMRDRRVQRDAAFKRAEETSGVDRAKALDSALAMVSPYASVGYIPVMQQILNSDPSDQAHLRGAYYPQVTRSIIDTAIQHEVYPLIDQRQFRPAIDCITTLLHDESPPPDQRQLLLAFQGQLYRDLGDNRAALRTLDLAIAADPGADQVSRINVVRDQIVQHSASPR